MRDQEIKKVEVKVFHDMDMIYTIPEEPEEFLEFWKDKFKLIPEEFKDSGRISLEQNHGYSDEIELEVTISYSRPETKEEINTRLKKVKDREHFTENQELCELVRLRKKYDL